MLLSCDHQAQDMIRQTQPNSSLTLKEDEACDEDQRLLVEQILDVIALKISAEKLRREVDLLAAIHE